MGQQHVGDDAFDVSGQIVPQMMLMGLPMGAPMMGMMQPQAGQDDHDSEEEESRSVAAVSTAVPKANNDPTASSDVLSDVAGVGDAQDALISRSCTYIKQLPRNRISETLEAADPSLDESFTSELSLSGMLAFALGLQAFCCLIGVFCSLLASLPWKCFTFPGVVCTMPVFIVPCCRVFPAPSLGWNVPCLGFSVPVGVSCSSKSFLCSRNVRTQVQMRKVFFIPAGSVGSRHARKRERER